MPSAGQQWAGICFSAGGWHCDVPYSHGARVAEVLATLARQYGVVDVCLATTFDFRPGTVLRCKDPMPASPPTASRLLYVRPRQPTEERLYVSLYVEVEGQTGCIPVSMFAHWPPQELDAVVCALSGTGAVPDFWLTIPAPAAPRGHGLLQAPPFPPRRLHRETPLCLQLAGIRYPTMTWTFQAERRSEPSHWQPALAWRANGQSAADNVVEPTHLFWAAQRDLDFTFDPDGEPSPRHRCRGDEDAD